MSYKFNFDLSNFSQSFFREIVKISYRTKIHKKVGGKAKYLVEKFKIDKFTGLPFEDTISIVEDLIDTYITNIMEREEFLKTKKRVLLLPHCSRKFMDNRCKATFDSKIPSYFCNHCSQDCLVNKATNLAKEKGHDIFVISGGSCITKILEKNHYDGVIGVACCEEIMMTKKYLKNMSFKLQALPLIKNGCANTRFNIKDLEAIV